MQYNINKMQYNILIKISTIYMVSITSARVPNNSAKYKT